MGIISAGMSVLGGFQQQKQNKIANTMAFASAAQKNLELQRQRLDAIRKARIDRANAIAAAAAGGTQDSSTMAGAAGSIQSEMESNLAYLGSSARQINTETTAQAEINKMQGQQAVVGGFKSAIGDLQNAAYRKKVMQG